MANSDYVINGGGTFASVAKLKTDIGTSVTTIYFEDFRNSGVAVVAGDPILVGQEIMRVDTFASGKLTVGRGCMDTVPTVHEADTVIWFLKNSVGSNGVTYAEGEEIGVKAIPRGVSKPPLALALVPPRGLTFARRFDRPYPPGNVQVNGEPVVTSADMPGIHDDMVITWSHRDRIVQADQLVDTMEGHIGPEAGVEYILRFYRVGGTIPVSEHTTSDPTFTYTPEMAQGDFTSIALEEDEESTGGVTEYNPEGLAEGANGLSGWVQIADDLYLIDKPVIRKVDPDTLDSAVYGSVSNAFRALVTDGASLFAIDSGAAGFGVFGKIHKFDTTIARIAQVELPALADGFDMVFCDGSLWAVLTYTGVVRRIDPADLSTIDDIALTAEFVATDGTYVYALDSINDSYVKIDPATNTIVDTVALSGNPHSAPGGTFKIAGGHLWVSLVGGTFEVRDLSDNSVVPQSIVAGNQFSAIGNTVAILYENNEIKLYDASTCELLVSFFIAYPLNERPRSMTLITRTKVLVFNGSTMDYYTPTAPNEDGSSEIIEPGEPVAGEFTLHSVRDDLESLYGHRFRFNFGYVQPYGLGYRLGESLGGVEP